MKYLYNNLFSFFKYKSFLIFLFLTNFAFSQNVDVTATVGTPTGTYTTLGAAVAAINAGTHKGVIGILIKGDTTETGTGISLLASTAGNPNYSAISIQPLGARTVSGAITAGSPLFNFDGADNVTINGLNTGSNSLTFTNTTASANAGTSTFRFINDATTNTIQNCTIRGATTDTAAGVVFFSTAGSLNGNDTNTITTNNITNVTNTDRPVNAIYSAGTSAKENSGNTISNNNIYNTFNLSNASNGIQLAANNTIWTISGNSFYETATFTPTANVAYTAINVSATTSTAITISRNFIGGNAASCGGTFTKAVSPNTSNAFTGISINGGEINSIQKNTIKNISWTNFEGANWTGIVIIAGAANVGTETGNIIGDSTGNGSITVNNNGNGNVSVFGINITTIGTVDCQNNTIGSINAVGLSASITNFYGINKNAASGIVTLSNNSIGSTTTAFSINASTASGNEQLVYGINVMPNNTSSITVNGNIIANLRNVTSNTNTSRINGIALLGDAWPATNTINNNTIFNLTIGNASNATGFNASVSGIAFTASGFFVKSRTLTGNTIYNLSNTNASFAGNIYGIYYDGAAASGNIVSRNFIHDLSVANTSTAATIYGLYMFGGGTTFSNNVIALGGNTQTTIYGIYDIGNQNQNFFTYYNTISISGNVASGTNKSYGIFSGYAGGGKDIRNNVIANTRSTVGGSNLHYGLYLDYYTALSGTFKVNNNNYYTPGTGGVAGYWSATNIPTAPIVTGELNSFSLDPYFDKPDLAASVAVASDYKISQPSLVGVTGTGITTDYAGTTRSVSAPVMGAFEALMPFIRATPNTISTFHYESGAGPSHELTTKVFGLNLGSSNITITPPTNYEISLTSDGAFVATNPITLTQISGSVATTTIYIRLKAGLADGTYTPTDIVCTATGATTRNITCSGRVGNFPVIYTSPLELYNLSYVTTGPSLPQSYVISGKFLTANIIITPPTEYEVSKLSGGPYNATVTLTQSGGNVGEQSIYVRLKAGNLAGSYDNKVLTNTSTGAYTEFVTLNGIVSSAVQVWKSGVLQTSYATLKATFDKVNDGTHKGILELKIAGNTTESAPAVLNASGTGSASYSSINIFPVNTGLSITGSLTELIDLNGADNVTIDGRLNATGTAKDLTINNPSTVANASTIRFINDATANIVKYCTIKGSTTGVNYGIVYFSTAGSGSGNDNNLIDNNTITSSTNTTRPYYALSSLGTSTAKDNSNNTVSNNNFVDFFCSTYFGFGINIAAYNSTWTISGNSFYETTSEKLAAAYTYKAISIDDTNGVGFVISGNFIGGNAPLAAGMWTKPNTSYNSFIGIYVKVGTSQNTTIVKNVIKNISWLNSAEAAWTGIIVDGGNVVLGTGNGNGNTIGAATGTGSITFSAQNLVKVKGIEILSTGTVDCQNNSIGSITAANNGAAGRTDFYGILKSATAGTTTISNNLIGSLTTANSIDATCANTNGGQEVYGIISQGSGNIIIDGNTVANLNHRNTTAVASGIINGIRVTAGSANTITNNTVGDLTIANVGGTGREASITGINLNNTAVVKTVTGNTIYNLSNTRADYAGDVNGLYFEGNTGLNVITKNFIRDLSVNSASTAASIFGINIASGAGTYANNVISLGGNTKTTLYGIYDTGAANQTCNLYFNTIYVGGSLVSGTTNKSYCVFGNAAANIRNFRNNIFRNERSTVSGASLHYTVSQTAATGLTSDYNNYTVTGVGGNVGFLGSDRNTLANWKSATLQDVNSISVDPNFVNVPSTVAADYKLFRRNFPGVTGTGITDDFESVSRGATPNMGAFQNFVVPPVETFVNNISQYGYLTLKRAFDHINAGVYQGTVALPLTIKINANTTETATAVLNASGTGASLYNTLPIYPTATGLSITGNLNAPIIDFNGADYVTLDGRVNATGTSTDLSIINTSTSNVAGTSTVRYLADATNNIIKYCTIAGSSTNTASGTVFFSTGTTTGNDTNTITNNTINAAGSNLPINGIYSVGTSAAIDNSGISITNNNIQDYFSPTSNSYGIGLLANNASWTITGNKLFQTNTRSVTANGLFIFGIGISSTTAGGYTINNNTIGYANATGTGTTIFSGAFATSCIGIGVQINGTATTIQGNTVGNISSSSAISGIALTSVGSTTTFNVNSNNINNLASTATGGNVAGIYSAGNTTALNISSNAINTLSSVLSSGIVSGIETASSSSNLNIFSNTIHTIQGTGVTSPIANGISIGGGTTVNVYKNKIYNIAQNGTNTGATVNGLNITGGTTVNSYNNVIGDLKAPATSNNFAINGIFVNSSAASTGSNLYYNTINIAASSSGTNFGTSGIRHTANATPTIGALDLRNNIIFNTSTPSGTGKTIAFSRSSTALNNYVSTSNNNLFYAGVASANNLIYSDGTNNDQTLTTFQTRVSTRETNSQTGIITFLSTTGSDADFLKPNFTNDPTSTLINGKAVAIATFTDDYIGTTRQTVPDIGAYESICNVTQLAVTPSGTVTTCIDPQLLTASVVEPNAVYQWKKDGVPVGINSSTYSATTSGNYTVEYAFCGAPSTSAATAVTINAPTAPTAAATQAVCAGTTIAGLSATGTAIKWYAASSGGTALPTIDLVAAGTYYASQTLSTCESPRVAVPVTLNPAPLVSLPANAVVCANKITPLTATGNADTYTWASTIANTLFTDAAATIAYVPGSSATTVYLKTPSTATVTATATITATSCTKSAITALTLSVATTTYTGTYSNGPPDNNKAVIFSSGTLNINSDLEACSCTVNGATVTVNPNVTLNVINGVNVSSGSLTFENGASLLQGTNVTNTGSITYKRTTTPMKQFDFQYWGAPVANQTIGGIWMSTIGETFYTWNTSASSWVINGPSLTMVAGKGYIARARTTPLLWTAGTAYTGLFQGVPNNGDYSTSIVAGGTGIDINTNLLGNPYPSALDIKAFWEDADNNDKLTGFFSLWTHNTAITNNAYTSNDYAIYGAALNAGIVANTGGAEPTRNIGAGQGFFAVASNGGGSVTFKNKHRVASNNSVIFRNSVSQTSDSSKESHKIWLNVSNNQGAFKQQMLTYTEDATDNYDLNYDAPAMDGNSFIDFYSVANSKNYAIQSKALPFNVLDLVPLGFKSTVAANFIISIDHFDGIFANQNVYLQDNLLGVIHNLKQNSYSFTSSVGTFNNRFVLRYTNGTLGTDDSLMLENNVFVTSKEDNIMVKSLNDTMTKIIIFDVLGRKLFNKNNVNGKEILINAIIPNQQTLLIKITLENGVVVTKKLMH